MKINLHLFKFAIILGVLFSFSACNTSEQKNDKTSADTLNQFDVAQSNDQTFYLIPSPEDLFAFSEKGKLNYSDKVLNPTTNADKYTNTKAKELCFGVYSADMAYNASFSKYQETVKYLKVVREFSDEIGISVVFNEGLVKRIDNIIENKDSLKKVTSDSYYDVVKYLEKNQRKRTLSLIATGGWLETMYIVTSLFDKYSDQNPTAQLIADQKDVFGNLVQYLEQNKQDESIKTTLEDLEPVRAAYEQIQKVKIESKEKKSNEPNKISVGGGSKNSMNEAQYKQLKEAIAKVRNKLTLNNVK